MIRTRRNPTGRPGAAAVWTLVVITFVAALGIGATAKFASLRTQVDAERNRVQALWLARSGFELAADRLMANPDGYTGETVNLIPGGEVKIVVRKQMKKESVYEIETEAKFREGSKVVTRTDHRSLKLQKTALGVRAEVIANEP